MAANPHAYGDLKPTHNRELVTILESDEYPSPTAMANMLVKRLDELRSNDVQYITVRQFGSEREPVYFGTGPYKSADAARKAIAAMRTGEAFGGKVAVIPTYSPSHIERRLRDTDTFPERHVGHWAHYRERVGV